MLKHFKKQFEFDIWANTRVIKTLEYYSLKDTKIELLYSHIINSQQIWYSRIKGDAKGHSPWDIIPSQSFLENLNIVNKHWVEYLDKANQSTLNKTIVYKNMQGVTFNNTVQDILTHVVNHSTYHRAQISAQIKAIGKTPPMTDYIAFAREK